MILEVRGLVVNAVNLSDADRLVTVYTAEKGLISAVAKNSQWIANKAMSATRLFCYARFLLYRRNDKYWIRDSELIDEFWGLQKNLGKISLASYICDVTKEVATNQPEESLLRLSLNSLYALSYTDTPEWLIKAAFEIRCACEIGLMPDLHGCSICGRTEGSFLLYVMDGVLTCDECRRSLRGREREEGENKTVEIVTPGIFSALRYVASCPPQKLFSFRLSGEDVHLFEKLAESYLTNQIERSFKSLSFYHQVKEPPC